ncbi:MAG: hypothetical protein KA750_11030, partial [Thermoflexales bacterium]|nr:hypothetical protein [Thermoflexales bacterium]
MGTQRWHKMWITTWLASRSARAQLASALRRWWRHDFPRLALGVLLLTTLRFDVPQSSDRGAMLDRLLAGQSFDFVAWIADAVAGKLGHELIAPQVGMSETARIEFVRDYVRRISALKRLDTDINRLYVDPKTPDPALASADMRAQRDRARADLVARQELAESILQEQIEGALRDEEFALGGQVMPPLRFKMTQLPHVLIVSRRDRIERIDQRELQVGLTVDQFDSIERSTEKRFNISSFVTAIGGLGAYPTMLPETPSLPFIIDTAAHEWVHNYLLFRLAPVAVNYGDDPVSRIINETTAVIVQREIGAQVLKRFYPEAARDIDMGGAQAGLAADLAPQPAPFDFNAAMRETRLRADELLAAGQID